MMLDWLQLPHQWTVRGGVAWAVATGLKKFRGRKATEADGLWLLTQIHLWALGRVIQESDDLAAELARVARIEFGHDRDMLRDHLRISEASMGAVLQVLQEEGVLVAVTEGWVIEGLERRYLPLLLRQQAGRHRVRSIRRLWAAGWEKGAGKAWVHKKTGREAPGWREAVAMMDAKKEAPHAQA